MHVWNFHIEEFMKEEGGKEEGKELLFIKMKLLRDPLQEKFPLLVYVLVFLERLKIHR